MEQQEEPILEGDVESLLHSGQRTGTAMEASQRLPSMNSDCLLGAAKKSEDESSVKPVNIKSDFSYPLEQGFANTETFTDGFCHQTSREDIENTDVVDLDAFNLIEPPPLDWGSDSSSKDGSVADVDDSSLLASDLIDTPEERLDNPLLSPESRALEQEVDLETHTDNMTWKNAKVQDEEEEGEEYEPDEDHTHIQELLAQLQPFRQPSSNTCTSDLPYPVSCTLLEGSLPISKVGMQIPEMETHQCTGLLFSESNQKDFLELLEYEEGEMPLRGASGSGHMPRSADIDAVISVSYSQEEGEQFWDHYANSQQRASHGSTIGIPECVDLNTVEETPLGEEMNSEGHPAYKDVPGPCDPEDLLDGVIFGAKYLGSTQLMSEKNPSTNVRMAQAQEAVDRIKAPDGETQPMTEVDLFISTQRIKVLSADTQESMMDHPLQTISYIADIGSIVVLMARRKPAGRKGADGGAESVSAAPRKNCCMICHVFTSEDAQVIAQAIGQAFGVAYQQFLHTHGIKASDLHPREYSDYMGTQELYNGDLVHFSRSENIREVHISKAAGEILGLAIVESGWGSILPTVVVANLLHGGPAERSGELSIGDRIMSVNSTSLVGLPIGTCQSVIRDLKCQTVVKMSIVHCPPVTMAIIKRPDPKYQLGFSVEDGIICSLMRGGIAERGGIRVGHRIIEINGQSVVATPHEKIIDILTHAVGEIHLKTMPVSTYRLLTGQEQPLFL